MDWLKKAPTSIVITVIIVAFLGVLAALGGFLILAANGQDTTEYRSFINTLANLTTVTLAGTGAVAGISAARSASRADDQTNGQLAVKEAEIAELRRQLNDIPRYARPATLTDLPPDRPQP